MWGKRQCWLLEVFPQPTQSLRNPKKPRTRDLCSIVIYTFEDCGDGHVPGKQSPGQTWQPPSKLCLLTRSQAQTGLVQWLPGIPVQLGPSARATASGQVQPGTRLKALSSWQSPLSMSVGYQTRKDTGEPGIVERPRRAPDSESGRASYRKISDVYTNQTGPRS